AYEQLSAALLEHLVEAVPRPPEMSDGTYRRTLRARAFDVARSLLPLATHTSVGQIVSARVLERQIGRLLGSAYAEVRAIGVELKAACEAAPASPLDEREQPPAAPTLVKYADASAYVESAERELRQAAVEVLGILGEPDRSVQVELAEPAGDPLREIVATLLYRHDAAGHSYREVQQRVGD